VPKKIGAYYNAKPSTQHIAHSTFCHLEEPMKKYENIESNPNVMFGKPVIKNTRITVEQVLRKLSGGMTAQEIIEDHPHLRLERKPGLSDGEVLSDTGGFCCC
jgi:uncharacterized protein (DUF433 family)